jgi:hypothetical protein
LPTPAQVGFHPGHHFKGVEGLFNLIITAHTQAKGDIHGLVLARQSKK